MATPNLVTFSDWQQKTNASLMSCAEELLEKLEDTSDLLSEIDEKYIRTDPETEGGADDRKSSMIQRFHAGLDSARNLVNVLKREKWRLSKREMSVELRMGELEDYKTHLKNDMSSLNQTVEALSLRVVQLENQLVDAQEIQEGLEADLQEHRTSLQSANERNMQLYTENEDLKKQQQQQQPQQSSRRTDNLQKEVGMLKDEVSMLSQENSRLKEMLREAEALATPPPQPSHPPPVLNLPPRSSSNRKDKDRDDGCNQEGFGGPQTTIPKPTPSFSKEGEEEEKKKKEKTPQSQQKQQQQQQQEQDPSSQSQEMEEKKKKNENLSKLTKEFLDELTSLELRRENGNVGSGGGGSGNSSTSATSSTITKKVSSADV